MKSREPIEHLRAIESAARDRDTAVSLSDVASKIPELPSLSGLLKAPRTDTSRKKPSTTGMRTRGVVVRINDFGLCEVATDAHVRAVFTLDKLSGYAGQPLRELGLKVGTKVILRHDAGGRVTSVQIASGATTSS